jgi:RNA polymerase sigma-70 factor, ECF subfamily
MTKKRTNEEWLSELTARPDAQSSALTDLNQYLQRSILYYLSQDRSDLNKRSSQELVSMSEDLAQDATLRVIGNLDSFRGESQFMTWANRIAIRLAISDLRRARYKDFSLDDLTADGELLPVGKSDNSPPGPETSVERSDVLAKINGAMEEALTERQYKALVAVALRGVPMDIVAEQLGSNRNALYKLLHDARRKLRTHLEAQGLTMEYMMDLFQQ